MSDDRPDQEPAEPDEPRFNPQSGWPEPAPGEQGGAPYYPPSPPQPPYGQPYPSHPQQGQPYGGQYGQEYGQPYGQPYGQHYPAYPQQYGQGRPNHPQAGLALGLGLGAVVGALLCGVPLLLSPFAWAIGHRARKEIRESGGQYDGDGMAQTGMILGIIGTVLLALVIVAVVVLAIALAADTNGTSNL
jgi:hypothetical protein